MSSIIDPSTGVIIKSDRNGRTRYTAEYKREVLTAFQSSSLSAPDFAKQCGIKYPTFAAWIAARKRDNPAVPRNEWGQSSQINIIKGQMFSEDWPYLGVSTGG